MRTMRLLAHSLLVLLHESAWSWAFVVRPPAEAAALPHIQGEARWVTAMPRMATANENESGDGTSEDTSSPSSPAEEGDTAPVVADVDTSAEPITATPSKPLVPFESPEPESWRESADEKPGFQFNWLTAILLLPFIRTIAETLHLIPTDTPPS